VRNFFDSLMAFQTQSIRLLTSIFLEFELIAHSPYHRFAVAFYYPLSSWPALQTVPWSAKYVFDDDVIRYVSIENKKKELVAVSSVDATVELSGNTISSNEVAAIKYESGPSILVHTSVPFGIEFKDTDEKVVYQTVLDHLNSVLPNLGNLSNTHNFLFNVIVFMCPHCVLFYHLPELKSSEQLNLALCTIYCLHYY
jgi:hypothetical protein